MEAILFNNKTDDQHALIYVLQLTTLAVSSIFLLIIFAYFKSKQQTLDLLFTYYNYGARNPTLDSLKPQNTTSRIRFYAHPK